VVTRVAQSFGKAAFVVRTPAKAPAFRADWVLITDEPEFARVAQAAAAPLQPASLLEPWTDDYSNLFRIIR
jgi:hypothetical protein